jgi:hypothetical protein
MLDLEFKLDSNTLDSNRVDTQRQEGLRFLASNRSFLGREFLTWLTYGIVKGYHYDLGLKIYVDEKIKLVATGGEFREMALKGGTPEHTQNLRRALLGGAMVGSLRVCMTSSKAPAQEAVYSWTMDAQDLNPKSLKIPAVMEPDASSHAAKRIEHIDYAVDTIERLFKLFLDTRMDAAKFAAFRSSFTIWAASQTEA